MHYDSASVSGLIEGNQIAALPLNGRNSLDLAKLEPGVQAPTAANRNRTVVLVLGTPASNVGGARFTVDGGSVTAVGFGGSQMGFSQEAVQEFQVSTVNFDLSAGMTDAGAINVVTRAGDNAPRATAFYFFRDHPLSAYPALNRDPNNPDPFFQRQRRNRVGAQRHAVTMINSAALWNSHAANSEDSSSRCPSPACSRAISSLSRARNRIPRLPASPSA